jgi:excisionase family DNA binding protein
MSMPRTQGRPAPVPRAETTNGRADEVLTLTEAAAYLRLTESDVVGLTHTQGLPGRCVSGEWRFLKAALQQWLATGSPTLDTRKAAILELSGKYKDDPDLGNIVDEAYRRRG